MPSAVPTADQILAHRDLAIGQMEFSREYLHSLLADIQTDEWLRIPPGAPSHIGWQVGHLAVAQYGLMLFRQRGRAEGDMELMPGWLRKNFGRGSQANDDAQLNPPRDEMLRLLDKIHLQALTEARQLTAAVLAEPADMPYAIYPMKLGALLFAPLHESIHIGQIGLLRRLLGKATLR